MAVTGQADFSLSMAISGWQAARGLPVTGWVDEETAAAMGESVEYEHPPEWYTLNLAEDPAAVGRFLHQHGKNLPWLKRLQGSNRIKPTGLIDVATAWVLEREMA